MVHLYLLHVNVSRKHWNLNKVDKSFQWSYFQKRTLWKIESHGQSTLSEDSVLTWVVLTQCVFASYWVTGSGNCWTVKTLVLLFVGKEMERIALRHLFLGWLVHPEEKREWEEQYAFAHSQNLNTGFYLGFFLTLPNIISWHIFHCHLKILLCNSKTYKQNKQDSKNILNK